MLVTDRVVPDFGLCVWFAACRRLALLPDVLGAGTGSDRDLGDRLGQANALSSLGAVRRLTDDYPGAAQLLEQALGNYGCSQDKPNTRHGWFLKLGAGSGELRMRRPDRCPGGR